MYVSKCKELKFGRLIPLISQRIAVHALTLYRPLLCSAGACVVLFLVLRRRGKIRQIDQSRDKAFGLKTAV